MFAFAIYDATPARGCCWRAIGWARSRSSTRCSAARCTSPARSRRCSQSPAWDPAHRPFGTRRLSVARLLPRARHHLSARAAGWSRVTGLRLRGGQVDIAAVLGRHEFDTDTPARRGAAARPARARPKRGARTARERGAARRVPVGRHRFGAGRLVHGEALGHPVITTTVGFGERQHNELEVAGLTAAPHRDRHYCDDGEARSRAGARSDRRQLRRAVRRRVGDPDLLSVGHGAPARDRGAQRRRRRRSASAATPRATCRTASNRARAGSCGRRRRPPAAWLGERWPRSPAAAAAGCGPAPCSRTSAAIRRARLLRRPLPAEAVSGTAR